MIFHSCKMCVNVMRSCNVRQIVRRFENCNLQLYDIYYIYIIYMCIYTYIFIYIPIESAHYTTRQLICLHLDEV